MSSDVRFSYDISRWLDAVASHTTTVLPANDVDAHSDNHNHVDAHAATKKRPRSEDIDSGIVVSPNESDEPATPTPRPPKRQRNADEPHFSAPPSPSRTSRYAPSDSSHSASSIASRNSSPVKQLQTLADDVECPVTFRDFDNVQALDTEDGQVSRMQSIVRRFADGIGVLEYETNAAFQTAIADIPISDQERMLYPWARRTDSSGMGVMPPITDLSAIKHSAWELNTGGGGSEDECGCKC